MTRLVLFPMLLASTVSAQLVRQPNTTLAFPSTLPSPTGYTVENALGSLTFARPICIRRLPGTTNRLVVVERFGTVQMVNLDTNTKSTFLDLAAYLTSQGTPLYTSSEGGLLSIAFHPDYNNNGLFFLFYSFNSSSATNSQLHQRIVRMQANGTTGNYLASASANTATHTPLITQRDLAGNHNGGDMHFGADGYLYISMGDGGAQNDGSDTARKIVGNFFAGIARIDVDLKPGSLPPNTHTQSNSTAYPSAISPGTYAIPPDNPFIGLTSWNGYTFAATAVRTEWYAHGFRNPWRISFDEPTGRLFVADVGQDTYEEVSIITKGANAGWSWREGLHTFTPAFSPASPPVGWTSVAPIYEYSHGSGTFQGNSVTGGVIYRGSRLSELSGRYIFADYVSGRIWALNDTGAATWSASLLYSEATNTVAAFGQDPRNGDILYCTLSTSGQVKRIVRTFVGGSPPPATLSATGAFSSIANLTPAAGVVPFDVNVSLWSDFAAKRRWFCIPSINSQMGWAADSPWAFPTGQIWIKHFDLETTRGNPATKRRLETRFLIKTSSGAYGVTYKWRADGSEADLVGDGAIDEPLTILENGIPTTQSWHYPSRSECMTCHTANAGFSLGFNTRQLNRDNAYGAVSKNQLTAFSEAGYFAAPSAAASTLPSLASLADTTQSLEWRVRSYLDANCSGCHRPGGAPGTWDARASTATDAASIIKGILINNSGNAANQFLVPGDLTHSVALQRLQATPGYSRMPPLGVQITDQSAVSVLSDWINALPSRLSFAEWQSLHFGAPGSPGAEQQADPDEDGVENAREYLLSTNPLAATTDLRPTFGVIGGVLSVECPQLANRSVVVQVSDDLATWKSLDHPNNRPTFPAINGSRTLTVPLTESRRYLRLHLASP